MAVHAKHAEDSVLIQKTKTILDKLTPQVVASEFPRILERIQAKRELIQVLGQGHTDDGRRAYGHDRDRASDQRRTLRAPSGSFVCFYGRQWVPDTRIVRA